MVRAVGELPQIRAVRVDDENLIALGLLPTPTEQNLPAVKREVAIENLSLG